MRGWPKGKPRKVVQQIQPKPQEEAKFNESVSFAGTGGDATDFSPDQRDVLYQEYAKQNYPDALTAVPPENGENKVTETVEPEKEEVKTEEKVEKTDVTEAKVLEEPKKEETVAITEKVETVKPTETKAEEIKTVPYGALHEERMKRKDLQRELDDAKSKMTQLMEDNVKLMTKGKESTENEFEPVYKSELAEVKSENMRLKSQIDAINQRFQTEDVEKRNVEAKNLIDRISEEEEKAGRPGFNKIGWQVVLSEIREMERIDPELASTYRNPDGWKLLHAKKFPEIRAIYVAQDKKDVFEQKKQAKSEAGLVTTTGKAPETKAPEQKSLKEQYDDYMKMRTKLNL